MVPVAGSAPASSEGKDRKRCKETTNLLVVIDKKLDLLLERMKRMEEKLNDAVWKQEVLCLAFFPLLFSLYFVLTFFVAILFFVCYKSEAKKREIVHIQSMCTLVAS